MVRFRPSGTLLIHFFALLFFIYSIVNSSSFFWRLIVIAEKDVVYNNFPIPLINRLEKHFLVTSTSLTPDQMELVEKLRIWANDFAEVSGPTKRSRWEDRVPWYTQIGNSMVHNSFSCSNIATNWQYNVRRYCEVACYPFWSNFTIKFHPKVVAILFSLHKFAGFEISLW